MIYIFGDSHRAFFTNTHPGNSEPATKDIFCSFTLGPGTAHNFYHKRHSRVIEQLKNISTDNAVIIVAGEVDCRLHIPRIHLETGKRLATLVENTVSRIMQSLLDLKKRGYKVIAWGPHPTRNLEELDYNEEWYAGTQQMRNQVAMAFNGRLQQMATQHKIPFVTTFYRIIKEYNNYTVYDEVYRDPLHLNQILWPTAKKSLGLIYDNYDNFQ